jgi:hypothetical protein
MIEPPVTTVPAAVTVLVESALLDVAVIGCADTTGSMPPEYLRVLPDALSAVVTTWASPAAGKDGSREARPALAASIRVIGSDSFDPTASLGNVELARLTGVSAPDIDEPADAQLARAAAINAHRSAVEANQEAAASFASLLAQPLPSTPGGGTEILGCFSAAAGLQRPGARNIVVAVSDLVQTEGPQQMGRLDGAEVVIVHICGDAAMCQAQQSEWTLTLTGMGAASVRYLRPEQGTAALTAALLEGTAA